jgi:hypothetical protein
MTRIQPFVKLNIKHRFLITSGVIVMCAGMLGGVGASESTQRIDITGARFKPTKPSRPFESGWEHFSTPDFDWEDLLRSDIPMPENARSEGESELKCENITKNPVIISSGEKYKQESEFSVGGIYGFPFNRSYRGNYGEGAAFGLGWRSNFDFPRLGNLNCPEGFGWPACLTQSILFETADGAQYRYNLNYQPSGSGVRVPASDGKNIPHKTEVIDRLNRMLGTGFKIPGSGRRVAAPLTTRSLFYLYNDERTVPLGFAMFFPGESKWVVYHNGSIYSYSGIGAIQNISGEWGNADFTYENSGLNYPRVTSIKNPLSGKSI